MIGGQGQDMGVALGRDEQHRVGAWYVQQWIDSGYLVSRERRQTNQLGGGVVKT